MKCEDVIILLDEFVDGELADADKRLVEAHFAGCQLCAEACDALEREQAMYSSYQRPVEAGDAMWAAIRERIEPGEGSANVIRGAFGTRRWFVPLVAAACLAIVAGTAFVAMRPVAPGEGPIAGNPASPVVPTPDDEAYVAAQPGPVVELPSAGPRIVNVAGKSRPAVRARADRAEPRQLPVPVADAERRYIAAIAQLSTEIERTASPGASSLEAVRKPLTDLDANIQTARRAAIDNPDDPVAVNSMLSAYDEKVETMQRLVALQARNDR